MGRVGSGWPRGKKKNLRSKDDVWTVVFSESPWTANRRSHWPRGVFFPVPVGFFLFLYDRFRLNHLLKHANKKTSRDDCCNVPVTYKTVVNTL